MADRTVQPIPDVLRVITGGADHPEPQPRESDVLRQLAAQTWRAADRMPSQSATSAQRLRLLAANLDEVAADAREKGN